ncbi:disease resistance protein Roq1-like isoform X2 [Macadamia integrifolia]|uniref:disease resistance protein Roq1-like isoform X2 n=1 Tax=Macadamia integrifolia TaxID=60698 RepID=UPI001C4F88EF|nr:disease resistance protein Roq1-like isoform X2 [Macadamia integrifolia]
MAGRIEASSSSSSSYASTAGSSTTYDVFLNFRGDDTRKSFTGHLYRALTRERIHVFMDSYELWEGEEIGPKLLDAIQRSKVSIPVFSKGYADSKWCLMELAKMLECHRTNDQIVLPIFLDVDPSDVRHQTGSFKEAFLEHDKKYEAHIVQRWRDALSEVGKLKGWVLDEVENGDESKLVKLVVERSLRETSSNFLSDIEYGIGLESRVNDLVSLVNSDSKDILFIGICGIGGIGKTTIAKALYNRVIERFCQSCFLANIREEASRPNGLVSLQKELVYNISHRKIRGEIFSVDWGKELIKRRLQGENVLLILDDVDHRSQLKAFGIDRNWLGQGSMVVITTRDEKILNAANIDEDKIYWPKELDFDQSLQLFSLHAFQKNEPSEEYMELSHAVTNYSGGLPLTLEVLGSSLSDVKSKEVWECTIKKLRETPPKDVYERLKISYDNLEDNYEKAIFLDSACFFNGWEKETLISLWEACGYHPKSTLHILIKRSLLKFECRFDENCGFSKYYMKMHDQICDMGRKIVADESFKEPGKSSRLWSPDEILEVLEGHKGTDMIKGMILPSDLPRVYLDNKHFEMMSNLRFLDISLANFRGEFSCLPFALRWLRWRTCPWSILPINFCHERLVYLDFSKSNIKEAWNMKPQDKNKKAGGDSRPRGNRILGRIECTMLL